MRTKIRSETGAYLNRNDYFDFFAFSPCNCEERDALVPERHSIRCLSRQPYPLAGISTVDWAGTSKTHCRPLSRTQIMAHFDQRQRYLTFSGSSS